MLVNQNANTHQLLIIDIHHEDKCVATARKRITHSIGNDKQKTLNVVSALDNALTVRSADLRNGSLGVTGLDFSFLQNELNILLATGILSEKDVYCLLFDIRELQHNLSAIDVNNRTYIDVVGTAARMFEPHMGVSYEILHPEIKGWIVESIAIVSIIHDVDLKLWSQVVLNSKILSERDFVFNMVNLFGARVAGATKLYKNLKKIFA